MNIFYKLTLLHTLACAALGQPASRQSKNLSKASKTNLNDSVLVIGDKDGNFGQNRNVNFTNSIFKIKNLNIYILDKVNVDFLGKKSPFRIPKKVKIIVKNGTKTWQPPKALLKLFEDPNSEIRRTETQLFPEIDTERETVARDIKELGFNIEPLGNKYHRQILSNNVSPHYTEENSTRSEETPSNSSSKLNTLFKMTESLGDKVYELLRRIKGKLPPIKEDFKRALESIGECAQKGTQFMMDGITKTFDDVKSSNLFKKLGQRLEQGGDKMVKFFQNFIQREKEVKDPFKFLVEDGVLSEKDLRNLQNFFQNKFSKKHSK